MSIAFEGADDNVLAGDFGSTQDSGSRDKSVGTPDLKRKLTGVVVVVVFFVLLGLRLFVLAEESAIPRDSSNEPRFRSVVAAEGQDAVPTKNLHPNHEKDLVALGVPRDRIQEPAAPPMVENGRRTEGAVGTEVVLGTQLDRVEVAIEQLNAAAADLDSRLYDREDMAILIEKLEAQNKQAQALTGRLAQIVYQAHSPLEVKEQLKRTEEPQKKLDEWRIRGKIGDKFFLQGTTNATTASVSVGDALPGYGRVLRAFLENGAWQLELEGGRIGS